MKVKKTQLASDALKGHMEQLPEKKYNGISPSQLGGCMRAHYWKIKGVEITTPPNSGALVNFQLGFHWEALIAEAYRTQGLLVKHFVDGEDKQLSDPETGLVGLPDYVIKNEKGDLIVSDKKTVNSAFFRYASRYKKFEDWVTEKNNEVTQLLAYAHLLRRNGMDIKYAHLSFASKDDGYIGMEFILEVTDELIQEKVISRALRLKRFLDNSQLPPCECFGWQIGYCSYGNPVTREPNSKKKIVNSECCNPAFVIKEN